MKILTLTNLYPPDFIGGYELACSQVVDGLRALGHDVRVLAAAPRHPVAAEPAHVLRRFKLVDEWSFDGMGVTELPYRLDEAESRYISANNIFALITALAEFPPDVVYVNNVMGLGGLGLMACLQYLKVPWAWQLGDCIPKMLCSTRGRVLPTLAEEFTKRIEGHYIVVSQQLRNEIESSGALLSGQVALLPYWITGQRTALRTSFYRGGRLRIMTVGHVTRSKGMDILIESAARLRAIGFDDFAVHIYGRCIDPYFTYLINKHDLRGHVTLMGVRPQAELLRLYSEYDVFAFPTNEREPFGMVPLEAVARGCVPVITQRCGVSEWLVHGIHCLKAARTAEAFAQVFRAILEGEVALEPIARRGGRVVWRDFHLDAVLPGIERVLERAARQPKTGAGSTAEAYRLARMAEQLTQRLLQEAIPA